MKEALRNVLRHAKAGQVTIRIIVTPSTRTLRMVIQDDGQGLDHAKPGKGNGLANMRKRIAEIGGTISIQPASPRGTCIDVSVRY
jgi:signal transduction histidine kinase